MDDFFFSWKHDMEPNLGTMGAAARCDGCGELPRVRDKGFVDRYKKLRSSGLSAIVSSPWAISGFDRTDFEDVLEGEMLTEMEALEWLCSGWTATDALEWIYEEIKLDDAEEMREKGTLPRDARQVIDRSPDSWLDAW